jgi:hypothetical protein
VNQMELDREEDRWKDDIEDFASKFWQRNAQGYKEKWKINEMSFIQFRLNRR